MTTKPKIRWMPGPFGPWRCLCRDGFRGVGATPAEAYYMWSQERYLRKPTAQTVRDMELARLELYKANARIGWITK